MIFRQQAGEQPGTKSGNANIRLTEAARLTFAPLIVASPAIELTLRKAVAAMHRGARSSQDTAASLEFRQKIAGSVGHDLPYSTAGI